MGDKETSICYQVTTEDSSTKIKDTILTFESEKNKVYEDFKELRFILISLKKPQKKTIDAIITNGKYKFDWSCVADMNDFIDRITGLDAMSLERISTFLDAELVGTDPESYFSSDEIHVLDEIIEYALQTVDENTEPYLDDQTLININDKIVLNFEDEAERQAVRDIRERTFTQIKLIDQNFNEKLPEDLDAITQCVHDVYNELKSQDKKPFEILLEMFKAFTPKNKNLSPAHRLAVRGFVLYFFDDCTIFEKTKAELQTTLFGRIM